MINVILNNSAILLELLLLKNRSKEISVKCKRSITEEDNSLYLY